MFYNFSHAYTILGLYECGEILKDDRKDDKVSAHQTKSYIQGYITGRNYYEDVTITKSAKAESLYYAVIKFCKKNPLKDIEDAAKHIYNQLR